MMRRVFAVLAGGLVFGSYVLAQDPAEERLPELRIDLSDALRIRGQALALSGSPAARRSHEAAEESVRRAVVAASDGDLAAARELAADGQRLYRRAVLEGLREEVFPRAAAALESGSGPITREQLEEATALFERAADETDASAFTSLVDGILTGLTPISGKVLPDLTLELWTDPTSSLRWVTPYPPVAGQPSFFTFIVKNSGLAEVDDSFTTTLSVDGQAATSWRFSPTLGEEDPQHSQNPLAPGRTRLFDYEATLPAGPHTFRLVVDSLKEVEESDESSTSNELEFAESWSALADLPDLVVEDVSGPDPLLVGDTPEWKVRIANRGKTAVSQPFFTSLKLANGVQIGGFWLGALAAEGRHTFTVGSQPSSEGPLALTATTDAGDVVKEVSDTNNSRSETFTVSRVDLIASSITVSPLKPVVHESVTIRFKVENLGPAPATRPFSVWLMPGKISGGLVQPETLTVSGGSLPLAAGASVELERTLELPAGDHLAGMQIGYTPVDGYRYSEKSAANNTLTRSLHVEETHYVKIDEVEYDFCRTSVRVELDRSHGFWKGDVLLKVGPKELQIPAGDTRSTWLGSFGDAGVKHRIEPYAVVAGQQIKSSAPVDRSVLFMSHGRLDVRSMSPEVFVRGSRVDATVKGELLAGWQGVRPEIWVENPKIKVITEDSGFYHDQVKLKLDVGSGTYAGTNVGYHLRLRSQCQGSDEIRFRVVPGATTGPAPGSPDLVPQSVWAEPSQLTAGQPFTLHLAVVNAGSKEATGVKVRVELDGGTAKKTFDLGTMKPGAARKGKWTFGSGLAKGSHNFYVYVDPDGKVAESNEKNNTGYLGKVVQ